MEKKEKNKKISAFSGTEQQINLVKTSKPSGADKLY